MKSSIKILSLVFLFITGASFSVSASNGIVWKKLGTKNVNFKLDRDVLRVGANEGLFKKLKIKVTGGGINMHKMIVEYGDGSKDIIPIKHTFKRGNYSRTIDLEGSHRVIKDITFWYDSKGFHNNRASIKVYGKK